MGYNRLFEWGTTLEDLIHTLCLQGKRLVAKTPLCDVSRHRKLVNPRGAGFFRVGFGVGSRGSGQGLGVGGVRRFGLR